MAYTLDIPIALDPADTGLTLEAQLVDTAGANSGAAITTGFSEIGSGNYLWHATALPDGHRGGVKFQLSGGGALQAFTALNPEEAEHTDVKTSTRLAPTVAGRALDVSAGGEAGVDWANVGSPTTVVGLSGTTVKTATDVETDTADLQARLPAALVSGRIDASVGAMAANTLTASALAADAVAEIFTTVLTEAYAADGAAPTAAQLLFMLWSRLAETAISGTTLTTKKLDGSTTAMTFTLDSASAPTSSTRAS